MWTKKLFIIVSMLLIAVPFVSAEDCDDYSEQDYQRALKGDKNMVGAKLEGARLSGVDLSNVDFSGADLEQADLSNADLTNAKFHSADLESTNLKGAKIQGAVFKDVKLEFATWVDGRVCGEGSISGCW